MLQTLKKSFFDELLSLKSSTYKIVFLLLLPLITFGLLGGIFYKGVLVSMPIVVVDQDKTDLSRKVLNALNDTKTLEVVYRVDTPKEGSKLLRTSKAYAMVIIPHNFKEGVYNHLHPQIDAFLNAQYILIAKSINATLSQTISEVATQIEVVQNLKHTQTFVSSIAMAAPIKLETSSLFNRYQNYFYFLVSALLPSILQIFIVIATIISFGEKIKYNRAKEYFQQNTLAKIIGVMLPYTLFYMLLGSIYLFFLYGVLHWEFHGDFTVLLVGLLLCIVAYQVIAFLFIAIDYDYAKALSFGAFYTAPAFAFLGVTFPAENMPLFASFWREMLPITHFVKLQIAQANYAHNIWLDLSTLQTLSLFWLLFVPAYFIFRYRITR